MWPCYLGRSNGSIYVHSACSTNKMKPQKNQQRRVPFLFLCFELQFWRGVRCWRKLKWPTHPPKLYGVVKDPCVYRCALKFHMQTTKRMADTFVLFITFSIRSFGRGQCYVQGCEKGSVLSLDLSSCSISIGLSIEH